MTENFIGQGISPAGTGDGLVQLWNPYGSGKLVHLDHAVIVAELPANVWGDLRKSKVALTPFPDHVSNKFVDGPPPTAEVRVAVGVSPNDYPYNRPIHEFWVGSTRNDRAYSFSPAITIPQGRGVVVCMSGGTAIASFQWSEETDPGISLGALGGTSIGDMLNMSNVRDGNETTYATGNGDTTNITFGIDLGMGNTSALGHILFKSPVARSFCGALIPRLITWEHFYSSDAVNWVAGPSGSFTDAAQDVQTVLDQVLSSPSSRAHRVRLSNTAGVAGWRLAEAAFYS